MREGSRCCIVMDLEGERSVNLEEVVMEKSEELVERDDEILL